MSEQLSTLQNTSASQSSMSAINHQLFISDTVLVTEGLIVSLDLTIKKRKHIDL